MIPNPMKIGQKGLQILKHYEQGPDGGFAPFPYKDGPGGKTGYDTVGWGHVLLPEDDFSYPLSVNEANLILVKDMAKAEHIVNSMINGQPTQDQFDAMVSLALNIGAGNFEISAVRARFNDGDMVGAAEGFSHFKKSGGVVMNGLVMRHHTESNLFLTGEVSFYN